MKIQMILIHLFQLLIFLYIKIASTHLTSIFSQLFSSGEFDVLPELNINLVDEDQCKIELSDEFIKYFIGYCQNTPIPKDKINQESAMTFHYLAKYYKVKPLIDQMENYFNKNQEKFIFSF